MGFLPKDRPQIDYGKVEIKKLPEGEVFGAGDLAKWSIRRADGKSGLGPGNTVVVKLSCEKCGKEFSAFGNKKKGRKSIGSFACRECGSKNVRIGRAKAVRHG